MLTNIYVSWPTSELRMRLVPLNMFKPSSIFTDRSKAVLLSWILFVFVYIRFKDEAVTVKHFSIQYFYWPFPGGASSVDAFCYLCFVFVFVIYCLVCSLQPCENLLWKGWPIDSLVCGVCFVTFPYGVPRQVWYLIFAFFLTWIKEKFTT